MKEILLSWRDRQRLQKPSGESSRAYRKKSGQKGGVLDMDTHIVSGINSTSLVISARSTRIWKK